MSTIKTDHKWKPLRYRTEVPPRILSSEFDWLSEEDGFNGFILYRGAWYHVSEFCTNAGFPEWDGFKADSYFSGVAIKLSKDGEQYKIATCFA